MTEANVCEQLTQSCYTYKSGTAGSKIRGHKSPVQRLNHCTVTVCVWQTPHPRCVHGRQRHWNIGGSQVERRRRENRGAVGGEWGRVWGGAVSLPRKLMNFSSQNGVIWCILGVLFLRFMCPMDCSCVINFIEVPVCA